MLARIGGSSPEIAGIGLYRASLVTGIAVAGYLLLERLPARALAVLPISLASGTYLARLWSGIFYPARNSVAAILVSAAMPHYKGNASIVGGLLGGAAAVLMASRLLRLSAVEVLAAISPALALAQAIGRLGCFWAGCCFGLPTSLPWGIEFDMKSIAGFSMGPVRLHPTQLYEALFDAVLFFSLLRLRQGRDPKSVVALYCVGYGLIRFCLEFLRADGLAVVGPLDAAQFAGLALIIAGTWLHRSATRPQRAWSAIG